jgi:hypothetical protein
MKKGIGYLALAIVVVSCAGKKAFLIERNETAIKYAARITASDLEDHLRVIASDEYEGRETGMAGQKKAAAYIQKYYESIAVPGGMKDKSYQQSFPLMVKDPKNIEMSIIKYAVGEADDRPMKIDLTYLDDFYYSGGFSDTTIKNLEMVFVGYGIKDGDFNSYSVDVKGKAVIMLHGEPEGQTFVKDWDNWRLKRRTARAQGAAAVYTIRPDFKERVERMRFFVENPQMQLHNKGRKKYDVIPNFCIPDSLANILLNKSPSELAAIGNKKACVETGLRVDIRSFFQNTDYSSENVLGFIEGSDLKDEVVVLSAHYDHIGYDNGEICNGADDDGSGTVAVLEMAEAFAKAKKDGHGPRRSILFLNVSGEEKGLLGSQYYVENPVYSLENTVVDLNVDMIGRIDTASRHVDGKYIYLIGADKLSKELHEISEGCNTTYSNINLDYTYNDESDPNRFYYRSDHYNFAKNGIPVIFYFSGVHEDYHKPSDEVDKIMFPKMTKIARLVFHTAWEIANRDEKPSLD